MEVEHCIRGDGEEIRNFLHRIKKTVDKWWPKDMEGIATADHGAERAAQRRQRRQRCINYTMKGLRPRYLQRKAQEYLMERQNATWNNFCAQIIQKVLILEVSLTFLSHEAQTKADLATDGQEIRNLRSDLNDYHVNAVAVTSRTFHPDQNGRKKPTWFCSYSQKNGHTLIWCRKKMRDEKVQKIRNDMLSKRKIRPIKNSSTEQFNSKPPNSDAMNNFLELDDRSKLATWRWTVYSSRTKTLSKEQWHGLQYGRNYINRRVWLWIVWPSSFELLKPPKSLFYFHFISFLNLLYSNSIWLHLLYCLRLVLDLFFSSK